MVYIHIVYNRILGTPTEEIWPDVVTLPDYKPNFPTWKPVDLKQVVPNLDAAGYDLLAVRIPHIL